MINISEEKIKKIIENGNTEILNSYAEEIAKDFAPQNDKEKKYKLSSSQIRNILDEIQRMKNKDIESGKLELLRPKIAYVSGRNKESQSLRDLKNIMDKAISFVKNDFNKFENFRNFIEAIVAYHKFYSKVKD